MSVKNPTLESLDDKVSIARSERIVPEGRAGLGPAVTKVGVQPETEFSLPSSNGQTVNRSSGEVRILSGPPEHLELRMTSEEEALPRPVEVVPELDGAGDEGPEHVLLDVLDAEESRATGVGLELPVQAGEAEPVPAGGEQQAPGSSDDTSWEVVRQARHEILREYLRVSLQLGDSVQVQTEGLLGEGRLGLERDHLTVTTRSPH